ncbi:hypothetical protein [Ekhidna sp.]|uniref:hypothetical protein n=1 Tax=Ekhidna sp. TaxID=2608089 RepID=UPI0032EC2AF0
MTAGGVACKLDESPDFLAGDCSEFEEDEKEVDRLIDLENKSFDEQSINHLSWIFWLIPFVIAIIYWSYSFFLSNELSENYRYTKATVYKVDESFRIPYFWIPSTKVYYRYKVDGKIYEKKLKIDGIYNDFQTILENDFLLIFSPESPSNSQILLEKPVSDKIEFPESGFTEPKLKEYIRNRNN